MLDTQGKIVFVDLETGGLEPHEHDIIQVAAVAVRADDALTELEAFEVKVRFDPSRATAEALAGNSYDPDGWDKHGKAPAAALAEFSALLKRHATLQKISTRTGRTYAVARLAGHNIAAFDFPFLRAWYGRLGAFLPAEYRVLDTMQLAAWTAYLSGGDVAGLGLNDLVARYGVARDGDAHDALSDVRATVDVARALFADLRSRGLGQHGGAPL